MIATYIQLTNFVFTKYSFTEAFLNVLPRQSMLF